MKPNTPAQEMIEHTPYRLFWLTQEFRKTLDHVRVKLEAGMSTYAAFGIASDELTRLYRQSCVLESTPPKNTMLEPTAVELQARLALSAALAACNGVNDAGHVRRQFWAIFRKSTNPSLTP